MQYGKQFHITIQTELTGSRSKRVLYCGEENLLSSHVRPEVDSTWCQLHSDLIYQITNKFPIRCARQTSRFKLIIIVVGGSYLEQIVPWRKLSALAHTMHACDSSFLADEDCLEG